MTEKILQTLDEAIKHAEQGHKEKNKPKARTPLLKKPSGTNVIKAAVPFTTDEYRENYETIFGHK